MIAERPKYFQSLNRTLIVLAILAVFSVIFSISTLVIVTVVHDNDAECNNLKSKLTLEEISTNTIAHDLLTKEFRIYENGQKQLLNGILGNKLDLNDYQRVQTRKLGQNDYVVDFLALSRAASLRFEVKSKVNTKLIDDDINCQTYEWTIKNRENERYALQEFEDCFTLDGSFWYGGAESYEQQFWPINNVSYPSNMPYLTGLFNKWSSIMERYWLSSNGVAIIVDQSIPLFVLKNKSSICLLASAKEPYNEHKVVSLKYDICLSNSTLHKSDFLNRLQIYVINNYFAKPSGMPDSRMFKSPIWSTWANFKKRIDEKSVRQFALDILRYNFSNSQLEIDDKWQTEYGDFTFDPIKFPNIRSFIGELNDLGFRTTVWVHPFANIESKSFHIQALNGYAVRAPNGVRPALTSWWDGVDSIIIDTTNPNATDWFVSNLENLRKETNVDSFKFDAGEVEWLPKKFWLYNDSITPDQYSINYARMAHRLGNMIEVRTGCQTQDLPIFVRMLDKDSNWGFDNGLKSVITTSLTMSILGYNYILPDMIGGNAYSFTGTDIDFDADVISYPDEQLYIRWAQVTAFLPSMQFSIPPFHYNNQTNDICKKLVDIHENLVYPVLMKEAANSQLIGSPIIRPLWWIDNSDINTLTIDDQFLVGNDILVAPITDENVYQRNVYLPKGNWKGTDGVVYNGPVLLTNYPAPIESVPYFIAV